MKIKYVDGLLQMTLFITYKGQALTIDKLVIGTLYEKPSIYGVLGLDMLMKADMVLDLAPLVMY